MLEYVLIPLCLVFPAIAVPIVLYWLRDNVESDTFGGVAVGFLAIIGTIAMAFGFWALVLWACGYI